jgi:hypothetical protein
MERTVGATSPSGNRPVDERQLFIDKRDAGFLPMGG